MKPAPIDQEEALKQKAAGKKGKEVKEQGDAKALADGVEKVGITNS